MYVGISMAVLLSVDGFGALLTTYLVHTYTHTYIKDRHNIRT